MTVDEVTAIASSALYLVIKVAAPVLLVSLVVGLLILTRFQLTAERKLNNYATIDNCGNLTLFTKGLH